MKNANIRGTMTAIALLAVSTAASAQEVSTPPRSVIERVEMVPLVPGSPFQVSTVEADQLVTFGCTFGPIGAFEVPLGSDESPCSARALRVKREVVRAGGFVYDIRRVGSMFVFTITDQAMGRNTNFRCQFNLLPNGQITENQCVNTANGRMAFDAFATSFFGGTGQAVFGSMTAGLLARDAGDTNINVGAAADATNNNTNNGGGGAAPNIIIDVTATGGNAGAQSTINGTCTANPCR